jgi:uncharacterized RDD family membrane protein YckC/ribosomal protein L40E
VLCELQIRNPHRLACATEKRAAILICAKCGAQIPEGASFCPQCRFPVSVGQIGPVYVPQTALPPETIPAVPASVAAQVQPIYAGFWLRAAAYLIDTILVSVVFGLVASFYPSKFLKFPDANAISLASLPQLTRLGIGFTFLGVWLYYAFFEASVWQATPGKRVLKLYVTDLNGRPLTLARATLRHFAKMISGLTILVGYFLAGFTQKKQALHDIIAGCLVLRRP